MDLNIMLRPEWKDDTVTGVRFTFSVDPGEQTFPADAPALTYPAQAWGGLCSFTPYDRFTCEDAAGPVSFSLTDAPSFTSAVQMKGLVPERPLSGPFSYSYFLYPRILPEGYVSSPYYDFRAEPFGLNGSGMFSFILPAADDLIEKFPVVLDWDLSGLPEGARAIWSNGEGRVEGCFSMEDLMMSLYQVGVMRACEAEDFGFYWFGDPGFDAEGIAKRLQPIFRYEKEYFHDTRSSFRVFLRRDPFEKSEGGSACAYAFISGYSAFHAPDLENLFNNLIHEMTHTWPAMDDANVGEGTWFGEGATEYYCATLPYRGGFLDLKTYVNALNNKVNRRYYNNPYRCMPAMEIPAIQWKERRAQTVPYGRGCIYLANVNKKLQDAGKGSLDDFARRYHITRRATQADWRAFVAERLGEEGIRGFEAMMAGELIVPLDGCFGPDVTAVKDEIELNGETVPSWHFEAKR